MLVLNNIQLNGYLNPYFYVLFIILLPFETPKWMTLVLAFVMGITIDLFSGVLGVHAFASVLMAYVRPWILAVMSPRDGYGTGTFPRVFYYGLWWFFKYSLILVFIHHLVLFYLEVFSFHLFFSTFSRVILSTMFSALLIVTSQYFIFKK
ncbi:hypothetical protein OAO55_01650 [Bacteroidales bacterium]|nr:hypothetical protein [Bacteroidales bacterium]